MNYCKTCRKQIDNNGRKRWFLSKEVYCSLRCYSKDHLFTYFLYLAGLVVLIFADFETKIIIGVLAVVILGLVLSSKGRTDEVSRKIDERENKRMLEGSRNSGLLP